MEVKLDTEFIRLDNLLKVTNLVATGGHAKIVIQDGQVTVNGEIEDRRGKKIYPNDTVIYEGVEINVI